MSDRASAPGRLRRMGSIALEIWGVAISFIGWTALSGAPIILIAFLLERG